MDHMPGTLCSTCPLCGKSPKFILDRQAFCDTTDCKAFSWDLDQTREQNIENFNVMTVSQEIDLQLRRAKRVILPILPGEIPPLINTGIKRSRFFDRQGQPIEGDWEHQILTVSEILKDPDCYLKARLTKGEITLTVHTSYLGECIPIVRDVPLVWETLLEARNTKGQRENSEIFMRYITEAAARKGHTEVVSALTSAGFELTAEQPENPALSE